MPCIEYFVFLLKSELWRTIPDTLAMWKYAYRTLDILETKMVPIEGLLSEYRHIKIYTDSTEWRLIDR